jgi:hypothetical protein
MIAEWDGWKFFEFPEAVNPETYNQARGEFVEYYRKVPGVHAIYRYGSVTYPGLSDLDFLVILEDDYRHRPETDYSVRPFSPGGRYAIYHQQFFIPRRLFHLYPLMFPIFEIEHLWGPECPRAEIAPEEQRLADTLFLCEDLATKFPELTFGHLGGRPVPLRLTQARLNLLAKFGGLLERVVGYPIACAQDLAEEVSRLRKGWFSRAAQENCRMVKEAIEGAGRTLDEMSKRLNDYVLASNLFPPLAEKSSQWTYRFGSLRIHFSPYNSGLTSEPSERARPLHVFAPLGLMLPLAGLASGKGALSQFVRDQFQDRVPACDIPQGSPMQKIIAAQNAHCQFLTGARMKIHVFPYFNYHSHYFPGVRSLVRLAIRKVRYGC